MKNKNKVKVGFIAEGTTCASCEKIIKMQAKEVEGVEDIDFDLSTESGYVTFDKTKTDIDEILYKIEEKGFTCFILDESTQKKQKNIVGWIFGLIGLAVVFYFLFTISETVHLPEIQRDMGYGLLFATGLLTGIHCVSMCGGFVVSYTADAAKKKKSSHKSHFMYGIGKTISYTVIGAGFGLLGSIIAFTPKLRGIAGIFAGLFLVLYGLKMLNIFPVLRKIQFKTPGFISRFAGKKSESTSSPLVIGLLNGLMIACGPLQAIYIMAAGTGDIFEGAKLLFVFALGTLPVMLGFGYITSIISKKATHKLLKASGVIVIVLGIVMMNNGLVLTGSGYDFDSMVMSVRGETSLTGAAVKENELSKLSQGYQEIRMEVDRYGWKPDKFVLKKGVPVKWIINGKEINGCNNAIQVPKYGLEFDIIQGEQVIEFTPEQEGVVRWSCWMGMIPGTFIVKEDIDLENQEEIKEELKKVPDQPRGSCGGACGNPSCGAATGSSCGCGG
ncbi:hypothetical protein GF327_09185 [Candidatus Woesearchaeota archaeon]|nr:hypothetical protein [Candidatus Woesearchaeota archaeon]